MDDLVQCKKCGWVHFPVTASYVRQWLKDWVAHWPTLDAAGKAAYCLPDAPPDCRDYLCCNRCGGSYKDMEPATKTLHGSTIGPILAPDETLELYDKWNGQIG
jgi:hypothetical protein